MRVYSCHSGVKEPDLQGVAWNLKDTLAVKNPVVYGSPDFMKFKDVVGGKEMVQEVNEQGLERLH